MAAAKAVIISRREPSRQYGLLLASCLMDQANIQQGGHANGWLVPGLAFIIKQVPAFFTIMTLR